MPIVQQFAYKPKALVTRGDVGRAQVGVEHLNPALFLELQSIKLHQHTGVDSQPLPADATPFMVRGFKIGERVERATSTWTGVATDAGALDITFGNSFGEVPTVIATPSGNTVDIQVVVGNKTATGFRLSWKDDTGTTHTSVALDWIAIGLK